MTKEIVTFKGFNKDLKCRDFQFEIGKTFHHDGKVEACVSGFHACECPFDVFSYYSPADSRFAETISFGITNREEDGDTKIASASITIKAELTLPQFIQRGIEWIWSKIDKSLEQQIMCGDWSAATNTGNCSAATNTGNCSAATNTGNCSAATNTGNRSAATNTGDWSAATNTGDWSAATNTGDWSAAEVSGSQSVAAAFGIEGKARASEGGAIVLCYRNEDGELIHIRASKVGENGIMPNTWYQLNEDGEFVACE
ncbi:hypothetical protein K5K43_000231 [Salmonella enterica subsp. enterica serovar Rissen]|nr:hypothetical protein [Salmonella enterica subsp. enterica serovar Rissen]EJE4384941.1 hypothetical protein [Salmonella enterica]EIN5971238.1 hypothetical protein [Salmonella enterica subsp. enterica serovar Rissen]EJC2986983.1 hypothetical protein [Salmonella enterica subsp. enterica serovar Rissen]EJE9964199.1 hypothetical protein [Salmonella enterica]